MRVPGLDLLMQVAIRIVVPRRRVGVSLVILDNRQRVLLLRHVFHPHIPWSLPGGWLNRHEDPAAGALRELREEIGLTADLGPVLTVIQERRPPHLNIAFLAFLHPGEMVFSAEVLEAKWFTQDALPPLFPFVQRAIKTGMQFQANYQADLR